MSSDALKNAQAMPQTPILAMKDVSQFLCETRDIFRKQARAYSPSLSTPQKHHARACER